MLHQSKLCPYCYREEISLFRVRISGKCSDCYDSGVNLRLNSPEPKCKRSDGTVCALHVEESVFAIPHRDASTAAHPTRAFVANCGYHSQRLASASRLKRNEI